VNLLTTGSGGLLLLLAFSRSFMARLVLVKDLPAAILGYDRNLGLLGREGQIFENVIPAVEKKLISEGYALEEEDFLLLQLNPPEASGDELKAASAPSQNKRGKGGRENK
jgi:hypothetical protein